MITSPEELKQMSEAKIVSKDPNADDKPERMSLAERMRSKMHSTVYGGGE